LSIGAILRFSEPQICYLKLIQKENEFHSFLDIVAEFHRCLDRENEEKAVLDILAKRKDIPLDATVDPEDKEMIKEYLKYASRNKF
jgi:hypothetical protein